MRNSIPIQRLVLVMGLGLAAVAGLLLHVVSHDVRDLLPGRAPARAITLAAALAGVSLGAITAFLH